MEMDVKGNENCLAKSKYQAFRELGYPRRWADLCMLIGCFGFYNHWLPLFEIKIAP